MKKYIPLILFIAPLLFSSCFIFDPTPYFLRIRIDSASTPAALTTNDTLVIKLYGYIGSDTCYSFHHFQSAREDYNLLLTVWGIHNVAYRKGCPGSEVYLNGQEFRVYPLYSGVFEVNIHQPDGTWLKKNVTVN